MRRKFVLALVPLVLAGCLSPFTRRLDEANARAAAIQEQLIIATNKFDEATKSLERSEKQLIVASATLERMENRLNEMDKRFAVLEAGFRKMFGIKGELPEEEELSQAYFLPSDQTRIWLSSPPEAK